MNWYMQTNTGLMANNAFWQLSLWSCQHFYCLYKYPTSWIWQKHKVAGINFCFRFGRKRTLMGSLVLQICLAVIMAFSPWLELYLVLRCCLGFISVSVVFSGFVLCKLHVLSYIESKCEWKQFHYCCSLEQKYFRFASVLELPVW
jgi:hypothetical protein